LVACAQLHPLFDEVARLYTRRLVTTGSYKPQHLTNTVWSFAKAGIQADQLFHAVAEVVVRTDLHDFSPFDLSNMAWAYAMARVPALQLLSAIAQASIHKGIRQFSTQDLATILWATARSAVPADALYAGVAEVIFARGLEELAPRHMSNLVWAFASSKVSADALFASAAYTMVRKGVQTFKPQDLSMTAWAFATAGIRVSPLFAAIADVMVRSRCFGFTGQGLSNIAWAFATMNEQANMLFVAIAEASQSALADFSINNLTNLVWAYAVMACSCPGLLDHPSCRALQSASHARLHMLLSQQLSALPPEAMVQLFQWQLWVNFSSSNELLFSPELRDICRSGISKPEEAPPLMVTECGHELVKLMPNLRRQWFDEATGYALDFALPEQHLAIVFNGPKQYMTSPHSHQVLTGTLVGGQIAADLIPNGAAHLKQWLLQKAGWRVVSVAYFQWKSLRDEHEQRHYLEVLLQPPS
jgi:hypothetical protein